MIEIAARMRPLKLAIIGGGPSGFYVASRLLSLFPKRYSDSLRIHIFDRLWSPHGLVRYGVAPDHPEVKNCNPQIRRCSVRLEAKVFGNINVTSNGDEGTLSLNSLKKNYTHLVFATGCTKPNLHPRLSYQDEDGQTTVISALDVVHWYTRHPSNPQTPRITSAKHVSIIGMGNVSLDVARMLLCPPEILEKYDVPNHVLEVLRTSQVKHVSVVGRRGPLEAAFTTKELREMMNLPGVALKPLSDNVLDVKPETRQQSRTLELLKKGSKERYGETQKSWSLKFYRDVMGMGENDIIGMTEDGIIGMGENNMRSDMRSKIDPNNLGHLPQLLLLHHTAVDPVTKRARLLVKEDGSPVASLHPTSLVITALGFHADPDSSAPYAQWYDSDTKHIKTLPGGRVSTTNLDSADPKIYASGWAATGAKGVLASTMMDAYSVADAILEDWTNHTSSSTDTPSTHIASSPWDAAPPEILRALSLSTSPPVMPFISGYHTEPAVTTYEDWLAIDAEEKKRGSAEGKERERMGWGEAKPFLKKLKERQGQGSKRNSSSNMNRSTHSP